MSPKTAQAQQIEQINRAERLLATIANLEEQIKSISAKYFYVTNQLFNSQIIDFVRDC